MKTLFFNPFEKYSEKQLLIFGLLFSLLGGYLGFVFNARFDGVIDLHFVEKATPFEPILDILIAVLCLSLVLFILGKLINRKTRIIDILYLAMIAKIPFYMLTFFNFNSHFYNITLRMMAMINPEKITFPSTSDLFVTITFSLIAILFLIWFIMLLYNGFKVATNAKEKTHTLFFVIAVICAEVLSKIVISNLIY